jgi:hypothetical protein
MPSAPNRRRCGLGWWEKSAMSTDEQTYPADRLLFMARTHHKVIDYYTYVVEELKPSDHGTVAHRCVHSSRRKSLGGNRETWGADNEGCETG